MVPSLVNFILAMTMFPEVQRKAQKEIDRVTDTERSPGFLDRGNLPYVESVDKDITHRSPVAPLGMSHLADVDLVYNDHLIPKGAALVPAVWWFCTIPRCTSIQALSTPPGVWSLIRSPTYECGIWLQAQNMYRPLFLGFYYFMTVAYTLAAFNIGKAVD